MGPADPRPSTVISRHGVARSHLVRHVLGQLFSADYPTLTWPCDQLSTLATAPQAALARCGSSGIVGGEARSLELTAVRQVGTPPFASTEHQRIETTRLYGRWQSNGSTRKSG